MAESSPAVFLDRDGTIMRDVKYCGDPNQVQVFDGVADALRNLRNAGFDLIVITNQSGIGRGYFSEEDYQAVEAEVRRQLPMIDATYFCPHRPDAGCDCRKPKTGLIYEAEADHSLDLRRSFFVGDKAIDVDCGRKAGLRTILVQTGLERPDTTVKPDWIARDLRQAAEIILRHAV